MSKHKRKISKEKIDVDQDEVEVKNQYRKMFEKSQDQTDGKIEQVKEAAKEKLEKLQEKFSKDH